MILTQNRIEFYGKLPTGIVAEIGVQHGDNAQIILDTCSPVHLYLIDCWQRQNTGPYVSDPTNGSASYEGVRERFRETKNVSVLQAYSLQVSITFSDEHFDWVYLDGDHTLQACRADLRAWWPKVKIGGFLCGHDYVRSMFKQYGYIQVREAVDEFCWERGLSLHMLSDEKYASWAIRRQE
jgi:hypothetical protein